MAAVYKLELSGQLFRGADYFTGIVGTIDSGDRLSIGNDRTIYLGEGPLFGIALTIDYGDCQ